MYPTFKDQTEAIKMVYLEDDLLDRMNQDDRDVAINNANHVEAFVFSYIVRDKKYNGFYVRPKNTLEKNPVIIFNRGGSSDFGTVKRGSLFFGVIPQLVREGYIVIGSQCMGFGDDGAPDEMGGEDFYSVLALKGLIDADDKADATRIGARGASRGGMTTYRLLAEVKWIKGAVVISGIADMPNDAMVRPKMIDRYQEMFGGSEDGMKKRSVLYWTDRLTKESPILIMHGTADWRVDPKSSLRVSEKCIDLDIPHRLIMFEGNDHYLSESLEEARTFEISWLNRFVKNSEPLPELKKHGE